MTIDFRFCRVSLLTIASVFAVIAIIVAAVVIPPVRADTSPSATPGAASTAFWVSAVLFFLLASALFALVRRIKMGGGTGGLIALGVLGVFLSFALWDAAVAFKNHDATLQTADTWLFVCAAAGGLGSILLFVTVLFLHKLVKGPQRGAAGPSP